jgi:hypothetical protein
MSRNSTPGLIDTLKKARKTITKPENHCQYEMARDLQNNAVYYMQPHAKRFCLLGACLKVDPYFEFPKDIADAFFNGAITIFNDCHSHAEVLKKLDESIEFLELTA